MFCKPNSSSGPVLIYHRFRYMWVLANVERSKLDAIACTGFMCSVMPAHTSTVPW